MVFLLKRTCIQRSKKESTTCSKTARLNNYYEVLPTQIEPLCCDMVVSRESTILNYEEMNF